VLAAVHCTAFARLVAAERLRVQWWWVPHQRALVLTGVVLARHGGGQALGAVGGDDQVIVRAAGGRVAGDLLLDGGQRHRVTAGGGHVAFLQGEAIRASSHLAGSAADAHHACNATTHTPLKDTHRLPPTPPPGP